MLTPRGWAAVAAGLSLWAAARLIGSGDLHMLAAGVLALPGLALVFVRWSRVRLAITRRLSSSRVHAGGRVDVSLTIRNLGPVTTSFLLLEDAVPPSLGRPARLVVSGVPPRNEHEVSYRMVCRQRGRYRLGPLAIVVTDPFGLARMRLESTGTSELVVHPRVEELDASHLLSHGVGAGESTSRRLHRSAADFYTMREYVTGDDLRRIHWPSVARTGRLMIRQDESTRRSVATVLLDNREAALGRQGSPGFERAVSAAASLGLAFLRAGFSVHLATAEAPPRAVDQRSLLDALAGVTPARHRGIADVVRPLRSGTLADTTLAVVTAPPEGPDLAALSRAGASFGRRIAVLVHAAPPRPLPSAPPPHPGPSASGTRASLQRAGWDVHLITPDGRLAEPWHLIRGERTVRVSSS